MDIGLVFSAVGVAKSLAEFSEIIDSLDAKVDRLVKSELNAGLQNLQQAQFSNSEKQSLLRDARGCFNRAVTLESGFRQGTAYLGLATCHYLLDDLVNYRRALESLIDLPPAISLITRTLGGMKEELTDAKNLIPYYNIYKTAKRTFTKKGRIDYKRKVVFKTINLSKDAKSLHTLQLSVSQHLNKPIRWLVDLESGKRSWTTKVK